MIPDFITPTPDPPPLHLHTPSASSSAPQTRADEIRTLALADLYTFARLVNPTYHYGDIHRDVFAYLMDNSNDQLLLLPRSHMKSHCIAVWCAWWITKNPATSMIYASATTTLAEAQLFAIKNIFTSDIYQRYWPEMISPEEGKREKWSNGAISVDHPDRKRERQRDFTIFASGLTTTTTGLHCEVLVSDDVVERKNAYTEDGRKKVQDAMSFFASVLNAGGIMKACGTRYHPADQYSVWLAEMIDIIDPISQELIGQKKAYSVFEKVVEIDGKFLWPRSARPSDGKMFGFDWETLNKIRSKYPDRTQYFAQYYNNPNDPESARLDQSSFQYYDPKYLANQYGTWYFNGEKLNLYAGIDFAFSLSSRADFTAIVVIGVDAAHNIYILELDRFKTDKISVYYEHIDNLHLKWGFRKLRAEVTVAQSVIVRDLKDRVKKSGGRIRIDSHRPNGRLGNKEERIAAALEPRYENQQVWHYQGGYISMLESELVMARPPHDDLKDVLAFTVETAKAPRETRERPEASQQSKVHYHSRFGGVS